jgi:hypothetical protein
MQVLRIFVPSYSPMSFFSPDFRSCELCTHNSGLKSFLYLQCKSLGVFVPSIQVPLIFPPLNSDPYSPHPQMQQVLCDSCPQLKSHESCILKSGLVSFCPFNLGPMRFQPLKWGPMNFCPYNSHPISFCPLRIFWECVFRVRVWSTSVGWFYEFSKKN